jgi:two-component system sensor histidine kinase KdpD
MRPQIFLARVVACIGAIAVLTVAYVRLLIVNPTTVALSYVVLILIIAGSWGIVEATVASVVAVFCFNFFFLPPVGTLTIADPQNWVALVVFLITAIVVSQLSGRARQRHLEALSRQRDLERLYALSRSLLLSQSDAAVPAEIARFIADTFELPGVALYDARTDTVTRAGTVDRPAVDGSLRDVARQGVTAHVDDVLIVAIRLGRAPIGSLAIVDAPLSDTVLQSITNLAAIGLERARGLATTARAEAARQSSELRAAVLDAAAHEFKTPLTSMKAAATALAANMAADDPRRELVDIVNEDLNRLQGLITDAVQMLRIDSGDFTVHRDRYRVADVVNAALRELDTRLEGHQVVNRVPVTLVVDADRQLVRLALRQLLDNAVKYSPPTSTIEVEASENDRVNITVRNSGTTIPERDRARIFERFYRGERARQVPGTGMGLAIVQQIMEAHGGALTLASAPVDGTAFTLSFPKREENV